MSKTKDFLTRTALSGLAESKLLRSETARKGLLYTLCIGVVTTAMTLGSFAYADERPAGPLLLAAQKTSDLMLATLFAALSQEFAETTPANVEQGKKSISLIFNDKNKDMRLVGVLSPIRGNDVPQDAFEVTALTHAMHGQNYDDVQRVDDKWYYRRSIALSNFHTACVQCHTNFGPTNNTQFVGALMLRIPITGHGD